MSDYTETSSTSLFSRLGSSIRGVLMGILIFLLAFPLLFWNESRAVHRARTLNEGAGLVQTISPDAVDSAMEAKLVHMTGQATTDDILEDKTFGISANAIKLNRVVEMYQWKQTSKSETRTKTGGSQETITSYDYEQVWSPSLISSTEFKVPTGHQNPTNMAYASENWTASTVNLGAYTLSDSQTSRISGSEALPVDAATAEAIAQLTNTAVQVSDDWLYLDKYVATAAPKIGDTRVKFEVVPENTVSIVAQQEGNSFTAYNSKHGSIINLLTMGPKTAEEMFSAAKQANAAMTWGLRVLGYFMMSGGLAAIFGPLVVLASVLPFLGNLLGMGTRFISGIIAFFFTFITIAIAWVVVRPILGYSLIGIAVIVLVVGLMMSRRKSPAPQTEMAPTTALY